MFNSSDNPQVRYSLREMTTALYRLMEDHPYHEITITMICQESLMSRQTFYRNCQDKLDLVYYASASCIKELFASVDWDFTSIHAAYENFFRFWLKHKDFLRLTWKQDLFMEFTSVFISMSEKGTNYAFLTNYIEGKENANTLRQFHHAFIIGGLCSVIEHWTAENFQTPVEELVNLCISFAPTKN